MDEFKDLIKRFKEAEFDAEIITELEERRKMLGSDASHSEVMKEISECLEKHLGISLPARLGRGQKISKEKEGFLNECTGKIKDFLNSEELRYHIIDEGCSICIFEFYLVAREKKFRVRIYLEADINNVRIQILMPFSGEKEYELIICQEIVERNYPYRYGSFKYDHTDQEISYEISWSINGGVNTEDLELYYRAAMQTTLDGYSKIRKVAIGKLSPEKNASIFKGIKRLIKALNEEDDNDFGDDDDVVYEETDKEQDYTFSEESEDSVDDSSGD